MLLTLDRAHTLQRVKVIPMCGIKFLSHWTNLMNLKARKAEWMMQISLSVETVDLYRPSDPRGCDPVYLTQCQAFPKRRAEIPNMVSGDRWGALETYKEISYLPKFNHLNKIRWIFTRVSSHLSSLLAWELGCLVQDCSDRSQKYNCWLERQPEKLDPSQGKDMYE